MATWPVRGGLLVVGVGRSGTSVATRLAVALGLRPPPDHDLLPGNEFNRGGYWESEALAARNDAILARWSSTWWTPPPAVDAPMLAEVADEVAPSAAAFATVFGAAPGWVWKDPRLTVLLPFWVPDSATVPVLVPFRDPAAVAASVTRRDGLPLEQSLVVWERHTRLLLAALAGRPALLTAYEELLADPVSWSDRLRHFAAAHGLPVRHPTEPPAALVDRRPTATPPGVALSASQRRLVDLCRAHGGAHDAFPRLELPPADAGLDAVVLPEWYRATRD